MSSFVDKLKSYLVDVLSEARFSQADIQALNNAGGYVDDKTGRLAGASVTRIGKRRSEENAVSPDLIAQNSARRTMYGLSTDPEMAGGTAEKDPMWCPIVKRYRFRALTELSKGMSLDDTSMILTVQTGKFLTYLFQALLDKVKTVDEITIQRINSAKDARQKDMQDMIAATNDVEFQKYCNRFINFLNYDDRFYPESYVITIKIPIGSYKPEDIESICKKFGLSATEFGVSTDSGFISDLPSVVTITLNVNCRSTLLNVFNGRDFFKVGTNRSSLEKYSYMAKNLRRIFQTNKAAANEEQKKQDEKNGVKGTYTDPRMLKSYISPSTANSQKVSYDPTELVSDMYRNYTVSNNNEVFCFLDETDDSYIYIPENAFSGERYYVLKTNGTEESDKPMNEISEAIKNFIEGLISEDELRKKCSEQMDSDSFKFDKKLSGVDDKVVSIVKDFFDGDSFKVTFDDDGNETDNYDEVLVKPIAAQIGRLPESDKDRYDDIYNTISDVQVKKSLINGYENKLYSTIFQDAKDKIMKVVDETIQSKLTATKFTKEMIESLTNTLGSDIHVFRFMYSDTVDARYTIKLPANAAKNVIKKYGFSEDQLPNDDSMSLSTCVPGSENLPRKETDLIRRRKLGGTDGKSVVDVDFLLTTSAKDIVRTAAGSMYGMVPFTSNKKLPDGLRVADQVMNLLDLTNGVGTILNALYFKPTPAQLADLQKGINVKSSNGETFASNMPNVEIATSSIVGNHETLIKRNKPLELVNADYGYIDPKTGKMENLANENAVVMAFNDYYDAIVNTRSWFEKWMKAHNIFPDDDAKRGSNLSESGNPATVDKIIDGITDGLKSNEDHAITYKKELSKFLVPNHFADVVSAYVTYLVRERSKEDTDTTTNKKKKKKNPIVELSYSTDSKKMNFSGDRTFVKGDRDAWLNGDVGALIPFYDNWNNNNLTPDLVGTINDITDTTEMAQFYYKKICNLCDVIKNIYSLLCSDGSRIRRASNQTPRKCAPWMSIINTGLPTAMFDFSSMDSGNDNTSPELSISSKELAEKQLMKTAKAADINNGFIISDFVKKNFRPIVEAVRECIRKYKDEYNSFPPTFGVTSTSAVLPMCPYHTMMYATTEGGNVVLYIKTTCGYATITKEEKIQVFDEATEPVAYDPKNKLFDFKGKPEAMLSADDMEKLLDNMANKDLMYCVADLFTKKYAEKFIKDTISKYRNLSVKCFSHMFDWIIDVLQTYTGWNKEMPDDCKQYAANNNPIAAAKILYPKLNGAVSYTEEQLDDIKNLIIYMFIDSTLESDRK